jgi:hypothetical protein
MLNLENSNRLYDELVAHQNHLMNLTKNEKDQPKLKDIEQELTIINNLVKYLLKTINFYKLKNDLHLKKRK